MPSSWKGRITKDDWEEGISFYYILKLFNYDFKKASEVFLNMTDIQLIWLNTMLELERKLEEKERRRIEREAKRVKRGRHLRTIKLP